VHLLVTLAPAEYSREIRASISGTVTDRTGAAVANATVTVTNPATNASVVARTNDVGQYLAPFLAPGTYQLAVEAAGFKRYVQTGIRLQTLDKLRVDVALHVGEVTSCLTVEAAVATLQTETASRSQIISNEMIANIPTQGRNPFQIVWAAPGVVKSGGWRYLRSFDIGGTTGFAVNGGRSRQNEVLQDGISNVQSSQQVIHVPTMGSVAEFKILTNTYYAQYGRTGGGIITIVTKSGTNDFHGSAFDYFQNAKMNANPFELNAAGTIASQVQGLSLKGQVLFASLNGQSRGSYNPDMNNFSPRIGLAYLNNAQTAPRSAKLSDPTIAKWFDTSEWIDPATGKLVTAQPSYTFRTYPYYFSDVRSPAYKNWDVSVTKYSPIYERMRLQFRSEAVNAFNHPWFTGLASGGTDVTNAAFGRLKPVQNNLPRFLKLGLNLQW